MSNQLQVTFPITLFYSYASVDERFRQQLEKHLILLQRQGVIAPWHYRKIVPGTDWEQAIDSHLSTATLILLLISPDFIASDYCYNIEMKQAMEQYEKGESRVIPIILRPVDWSSTPFERLQALPIDTRPVTRRPDRDVAFQDVAKGIKEVIKEWFFSRTAEEWLDKCEKLYDQDHHLEDALWCARQVLCIDLNDIIANLIKGRILREQGHYKEALDTFDHLLALSPDCMDAYEEKVRALRSEKCYKEALDACEQACKQDPLFAAIYYLKADLLIEDGRYDEALLLCQKSIDLGADDAEAHVVKSVVLLHLHHLEEALEACEQATKFQFYDPKVISLLLATKALALYGLEHFEEALTAYDKFIAIEPKDGFAFHQKAAILHHLGRYSEVVTACKQALLLDFNDVDVYKLMIDALWRLHLWNEGILPCLEITRLEPDDAEAYEFSAVMLLNAGRHKEALEMCKQAIHLGATKPTVTYCIMGDALYKFGRYKEALAAYRRVLQYPPDSMHDWARKGIEKCS